MSDALRVEWVRLTTLRSTRWLLGACVVVPPLMALLQSLGGRDRRLGLSSYAQLLVGGAYPVAIVPPLLGLVGLFSLGHEYRYGTLRTLLTVLPRREDVLAAKGLVSAGVAAAAALLGVLLAGVVAGLLNAGRIASDAGPWTPGPRGVVLGYVLVCVAYALVGLGLAALVRSMPVGIVVLLAVPLLVEPLVGLLLTGVPLFDGIEHLARYLPFTAGSAMVTPSALRPEGSLSPTRATLVLYAWAGILLTVASDRFTKRDA